MDGQLRKQMGMSRWARAKQRPALWSLEQQRCSPHLSDWLSLQAGAVLDGAGRRWPNLVLPDRDPNGVEGRRGIGWLDGSSSMDQGAHRACVWTPAATMTPGSVCERERTSKEDG